MATLEELATLVSSCTRCPLAEGRTQVVFGVGNPDADLLFVGEGPGREEDLKGEPFVGRSGQLLDRVVLEEMGLTRDRFYIANAVKCLRYTALVQLGDCSWERIGRLVARGYDGTVMSVDHNGRLVPRRVTGWHASPLAGRRVFKLSYRSSKRAGASRSGIELTGDHEVMTDAGWCAVQDLPPGVRVATGQGLSEMAFDVVCGTLLGDGHLNRASSHLSMTHSAKQREYAELKGELLAELGTGIRLHAVSAVAGGDRVHDVVTVRTLATRSLRILRNDFYPAGTKRVPEWIEDRLTARMLAFWFIDDGYLRQRPNRRPVAEIATCSFTPDDLDLLVRALARLGLVARPVGGRLSFAADEARKLSELIAPFVPPSMRYKLHPEVALAVRFDASRFEAGPRHVMYDEVDVTEVVHHGTDKTFYCIDVEETNNFVTSGGVVHNCRPPGNRDPLPAEIASCRPYLEQQIELIKPKVIVTLGNFATKLLLDTTEGITKLRGKTYPYGDAVLVPTFHPAAILRGGPVPLAQMRADLIRAKEALRAVTTTA